MKVTKVKYYMDREYVFSKLYPCMDYREAFKEFMERYKELLGFNNYIVAETYDDYIDDNSLPNEWHYRRACDEVMYKYYNDLSKIVLKNAF